MASLALSVNLRAAEYCRAQNQGLPSVAKAFGALMSTDALRNPISTERLQGPIVMIEAVKRMKLHGFATVQAHTKARNMRNTYRVIVVACRQHRKRKKTQSAV